MNRWRGLTRRCSGLATLAAELHIVRPSPLGRKVRASSFHPPSPSYSRLLAFVPGGSWRHVSTGAARDQQDAAVRTFKYYIMREAYFFGDFHMGRVPLDSAPPFAPRHGTGVSVIRCELSAVGGDPRGLSLTGTSSDSPRAFRISLPPGVERNHQEAGPNPSLQRTRFTRR